jgi:hypothetical protein
MCPAPQWLASHSSVRPVTASLPTYCLMRELDNLCQSSPKVIIPEHGNFSVCQNAGKTFNSQRDIVPKLMPQISEQI